MRVFSIYVIWIKIDKKDSPLFIPTSSSSSFTLLPLMAYVILLSSPHSPLRLGVLISPTIIPAEERVYIDTVKQMIFYMFNLI